MRYLCIIASAICSLMLVGCAATSGSHKFAEQTRESLNENIVEGKTTQTQVRAFIGEPTNMTFTDKGNEIYTYAFARVSGQGINYVPFVNMFARGFDTTSKKLVILFDENKIVSKANFSEEQSETKAGLGR